jgi:hypothetical protein
MTSASRDRDEAGRPRNARARDALGRPLARGEDGETPLPDDLSLPPGEALALAQRLLDSSRPFRAHEVLEASWKAAPDAERDLWQGLAQVAVGLTHAQRGNARGAVALLRRGANRMTGYRRAGETAGGGEGGQRRAGDETAAGPHGIDVAGVSRAAGELAARIERDGLGGVSTADLRVRLLAHAA